MLGLPDFWKLPLAGIQVFSSLARFFPAKGLQEGFHIAKQHENESSEDRRRKIGGSRLHALGSELRVCDLGMQNLSWQNVLNEQIKPTTPPTNTYPRQPLLTWWLYASCMNPSTVEARKLGHDCPPTQAEKRKPA